MGISAFQRMCSNGHYVLKHNSKEVQDGNN